MKRKLSGALAASLLVSQVQGVAFAENTVKLESLDGNNSDTSNIVDSDPNTVPVEEQIESNHEVSNEIIEGEEVGETESNQDMMDEVRPEETESNQDAIEEAVTEDVEIESDDALVEQVTEEVAEDQQIATTTMINSNYQNTAKLELDLNFSTPIKYVDKNITNITVKIINQDTNQVETIQLGSDSLNGTLTQNGTYQLEALNSKRQALTDIDTEVSFYHLTLEGLNQGNYTLEVEGAGYQTAKVGDIDLSSYSKRVLLGTTDNKIIIDDKGADSLVEYYPGVFLVGAVDDQEGVSQTDYDALKNQIKTSPSTKVTKDTQKYDLNRDGKIDITDLTFVHQNIGESVKQAEIVETDKIIDLANVTVTISNETIVEQTTDLKNLLQDNGASVSLKTSNDASISETNPVSVTIQFPTTTRTTAQVEQISIKAPSDSMPTSGTIVIPGAGENGQDLTVSFNEDNIIKKSTMLARNGQVEDEIVINLGKQVAVSQITFNVTGSRGNKNLTEISKVDFLNNVYKELPVPNMNVPVINYFTSATAVGNEHFILGWDHQPNVTGYELKVQLLNSDGTVNSTKTYKTSENRLKVEGIDGYATYRISIQSLSGSWSSGYKDDQEGYSSTATGNTNIENNANDKDGLPDNVNSDYIPMAWDSMTGVLSQNANGDNGQNYGADSIVELQVIPETAPEGPEGIVIEGKYKALNVTWKSHKKAKDYDLYYRQVGGDGAWIKANDPNEPKYVDSDVTNDIPDGVTNLLPNQKTDTDELIRGTQYLITGLEENATYEIKMTATNHHGTGDLSQTYVGKTTGVNPPTMPQYKLINRPQEGEGLPTSSIIDVSYPNYEVNEHPNGIEDKFAIVDNDFRTYWTSSTWNSSPSSGPLVTFDKEYTIDTIRLTTRLDGIYADGGAYDYVPLRYWDSTTNQFVEVKASYTKVYDAEANSSYFEIKLPEAITTSKIQTTLRIHPAYVPRASISEIKFYEYDSIEKDVDALFADELRLELTDDVTQETIDELMQRTNTIDPISLEYHPNQEQLLSDLQRAQDLLDDIKLSDNIISLDPEIQNAGNTIGQSNNSQALGVAVKPGDKVTIYIGSSRKDTQFKLHVTQHYAESGTAVQTYSQNLVVGKNEIVIPESGFNMDYEKGGNLYISFASGYQADQLVQVRVSGGTEIPHLNVHNLISDESKEAETKDLIRAYIRKLKTYVSSLPDRYPTQGDKTQNIYTYDPQTSILNTTEIEGDRITLSLAANQVLAGITSGLSTEDEQVERLYNNLLAWEQLMQVSYVQQGLLEKPIDVDGDGNITDKPQTTLNGKSEQEYYNANKAPLNRINIKYQRMFTGAFMYASSHHVGIDYGSIAGMMQGVPFEFDENGNLTNQDEAKLFGWGINHEIGHVHDAKGLTYAEVTNNILALITQTFDDEDEARIEDRYEKVYKKVTSGSEGLATNDILLSMFWQLHLAYDNDNTYRMLELNTDGDITNDTFYAKLYRITREKGIAENENGYDQTAQTFIMRSSDAVGKDLRPFFQKWGIVASPKTNAYLDAQKYPTEDKAIYYLNDHARRQRLAAIASGNMDSLEMAKDTTVTATFGVDASGNIIKDGSYLNQKEVPLQLSVTKDEAKILGYEIIRLEATAEGVTESPVGFVERDRDNSVTEYTDVIDAINNRTFTYKVRAYDYNLNVTEEVEIGSVKVSHDGGIVKTDWTFDTNTRGVDDVEDEHTGHGHVVDGSINRIKDNDKATVYNATKATNHNGQIISGDPYVTIEMDQVKSVVGLKYTPGTTSKKFSWKNLFSRNTATTYDPISKYEVYVSEDGTNWTKAHSGTFDTTKENTIYFNENGTNDNTQLWSFQAKYVKLVAKGATSISIAELDILGPQGDNIEIGMDNNDQVYKNGIGKLKSAYEYAPGQSIPAGSILVMGEYKGDPAFNVPLVLNEKNENFALKSQAILLANLPADAELGEVAEGSWIYWITPEQQNEAGNIEGTKVKAELYRYNKLDSQGAPVGQRLVSDTFLYDIDINNLPTIDLNDITTRQISYAYDEVVLIDQNILQTVIENR